MATKSKESSTLVRNEKKTPASSSHLTTTKRTTKPSTPTTTSTTNKSNSTTSSEKNIPNYLKPTTSFKQLKTETPIKPSPLRRRSLDKPLSSSNLTAKQKEPSPSRLHKALVSPGPIERSVSLTNRSSNVPVKSTNSSKPISAKTPIDAKTKLVGKRVINKSTSSRNIATSNTTKKVANDHASSAIPAKIKALSTDSDSSSVETEDVKEVTNQEVEVIKVDNEEHVSHEVSSDVNSELLQEHENDQVLEDSGIPQNQSDDEKVISAVSEEAEKEPQEEKPEVEHEVKPEVEHEEKPEIEHEEKENNNGNQTEVDHSEVESEVSVNEKEENETGNPTEEVDHSEVESEVSVNEKEKHESVNQTEVNHSEVESEVSVSEKEKTESGNQTEEVDHSEVESEVAVNENGNVIEDKKSENNNEEEQGGEEKEAVEGGVSEKVEEAKDEVAQPKQQLAVKGKNESQVSNGMIEETASKLLGRKNKVLALAGAFQTVIDHQTK